jgi:hypothetical protein
MTPTQRKATIRLIAGSFLAGASVMAIVGLAGPVSVQGGLSVREAFASTFEEPTPVVQPLDVAAIEAQLAEADRAIANVRDDTADEFAMLDRLSGR